MAEQKTYTQAGYDALKNELAEINEKIEENKKDISTARSYGDLSENSEYDEAKQEQGKLHARKAELEEMIANAKILTSPRSTRQESALALSLLLRARDSVRRPTTS